MTTTANAKDTSQAIISKLIELNVDLENLTDLQEHPLTINISTELLTSYSKMKIRPKTFSGSLATLKKPRYIPLILESVDRVSDRERDGCILATINSRNLNSSNYTKSSYNSRTTRRMIKFLTILKWKIKYHLKIQLYLFYCFRNINNFLHNFKGSRQAKTIAMRNLPNLLVDSFLHRISFPASYRSTN